ncbi:hypothetical protein [Massilia sp. ST3]|uniref:hypothetical protein n=1 Tax=Massilia sp. ST3 TaxID=2824903 RepID=UPI001B82F4DD|nr:hypothetical protein [Massilia sp. ST3]MBQ5947165.1 hypothetical protein [Massilia sp. ST3]
MDEHGNDYIGTVFVLPESRCFELKTTIRGEPATVTGTISQQLAAKFEDHGRDGIDPRQVALAPRRVQVVTREIHERHRASRTVHCLTRVYDLEDLGAAKPVPVATI